MGAHSGVFSQNRTAPSKKFTETVKVSQKTAPHYWCTVPRPRIVHFTKFKKTEYLGISRLDILYLLCFGARTAISQGQRVQIRGGFDISHGFPVT